MGYSYSAKEMRYQWWYINCICCHCYSSSTAMQAIIWTYTPHDTGQKSHRLLCWQHSLRSHMTSKPTIIPLLAIPNFTCSITRGTESPLESQLVPASLRESSHFFVKHLAKLFICIMRSWPSSLCTYPIGSNGRDHYVSFFVPYSDSSWSGEPWWSHSSVSPHLLWKMWDLLCQLTCKGVEYSLHNAIIIQDFICLSQW